MSHRLFDGDQVRAGLVEMKPEGMAEGMQVEAAVAESVLIKVPDEDVVDGLFTDCRHRL